MGFVTVSVFVLMLGIIGITGFLFYRFISCVSSFDPFLLYEMQVERDIMHFSISTSRQFVCQCSENFLMIFEITVAAFYFNG